jgi:hypothetical protein
MSARQRAEPVRKSKPKPARQAPMRRADPPSTGERQDQGVQKDVRGRVQPTDEKRAQRNQ